MRKIALIPASQRVERAFHFPESEADQLCILGVYLKKYTLAGIASISCTSYLKCHLNTLYVCGPI